jgi:CelD/BcsL family acetyltransferase involved in cellulose biosynthesis
MVAYHPGVKLAIEGTMPRTHRQWPITYRDRQSRVWYVSEVARLKVVSPAIDGPNVALVIRFEREGEERFVRWVGGEDWRQRTALHRLFAEAEPAGLEAPVTAQVAEAGASSTPRGSRGA